MKLNEISIVYILLMKDCSLGFKFSILSEEIEAEYM